MKSHSTVTEARLVNFSSEDPNEGEWKVLNEAVIPLASSQLLTPPESIIDIKLPMGFLRALSAILEKQNGSSTGKWAQELMLLSRRVHEIGKSYEMYDEGALVKIVNVVVIKEGGSEAPK
ncbi:MAG: hypothetical protein Q9174_002506 [Haloplaca sp. 1 TL-2023]